MLFNSFIFIFVFLPVTLIGFYGLSRIKQPATALGWLVLASLVFYGYWDPRYLALLIPSTLINYGLGRVLSSEGRSVRARKMILAGGLIFNIGVLGYFKYANFFAENVRLFLGVSLDFGRVILPLGISFFTFQKIAFLVDAYRGETKNYSLKNFSLFVFFFPQLIAGPIVHHKEIISQLKDHEVTRWRNPNFSLGLAIFIVGLFKKVCIADSVAVWVKPLFEAANHSTPVSFIEAWSGMLSYSFQLYFDFSGYSDMAIGLGLMFNILLPLNFDSPYKATSIIDFWRRWHMTLSRFLRDYVYISLGGNRHGAARRHANLMLTMLIGGLWHGANWTFVLWGGLHGALLVLNHLFASKKVDVTPRVAWRVFSTAATFVAVLFAWVLFRAESVSAGRQIYRGLLGVNGFVLPDHFESKFGALGGALARWGVVFGKVPLFHGVEQLTLLVFCGLVVWAAPNTGEWFGLKKGREPRWKPTLPQAIALGLLFGIAIMGLNRPSEFLYFQF
jgi:alginate O-acetyltransferase complex protein AlgI